MGKGKGQGGRQGGTQQNEKAGEWGERGVQEAQETQPEVIRGGEREREGGNNKKEDGEGGRAAKVWWWAGLMPRGSSRIFA